MSMLCSMSRKVTPRSLMPRMRSMITSSSVALTPAAGSSSRMMAGSAIMTRASSRSLRWPPERTRAGSCASRDRETRSSRSMALSSAALSSAATRSGRRKLASRLSPVCPCRASMTFSSRLRLASGLGIWKVRPRPRLRRRWADSPETLTPFSTMSPPLGGRLPASRSNMVVLPAPLGPIRPRISPRRTSKDTSLTASSPPKRRTTCFAVSTGAPTATSPVETKSSFPLARGGRIRPLEF